MNIRLTIQYDGTDYHGWQIQKNGKTIQQAVMDAIFDVTGDRVDVTGCGRTDAGVHGDNYICNFHTKSTLPPERLVYILNTRLPDDIVCKKSEAVSEDFCAIRSALKKTYVYTVYNAEFPDVFYNRYAWHYKFPLDIEKMQKEAQAFVGTHDFAAFAASGLSVKTTVRTIYSVDVEKENDIITISVTGNGFLYNMVRIIAGTLVQAGGGMLENVADILASCDRTRAGITAPACGLCLKEVFYDE